jgi:hypothetical protein
MFVGGEESGLASDLLFIASLMFPLYSLSVLVEGWTARHLVDQSCRRRAWRWAWLANGLTYGLILAGMVALALNYWLTHYRSSP